MGHVTALFILLLCCSVVVVNAAEPDVTKAAKIRAELEALNQEISEFRAILGQTHSERDKIEKQLQQNETEMSALVKKIREIETELDKSEAKLRKLKKQETELNGAKQEQQGYIIEQIRGAWALGNQEGLKVLLNQEDPAEISRMLTYYDYFNRARADRIKLFEETLVRLDVVQNNIQKETSSLHTDQARLSDQQQHFAVVQNNRLRTLAKLNAAIESRGIALEKMTIDRRHLEDLLDKIIEHLARIPDEQVTPFPELKGKMQLPVIGRIDHRYGTGRLQDKMKWQGVFISVNQGASVHAIHHGRVVFSDWLRGFGLLMIINHGDGYMSLYGHNQTLERAAGDWVATNEVISTAGNTGGLEEFGLYFEIRQNGRPRNPTIWCQARA